MRLPSQRSHLLQWGGALNALMLLSPAYRGVLPVPASPSSCPSSSTLAASVTAASIAAASADSVAEFTSDAELCAALRLLRTIITDHPPCFAQIFGGFSSAASASTGTTAPKPSSNIAAAPPSIVQGVAAVRVLLLDRAPPRCRTVRLVRTLQAFVAALESLAASVDGSVNAQPSAPTLSTSSGAGVAAPRLSLAAEAARVWLFDMSYWALADAGVRAQVCAAMGAYAREKSDLVRTRACFDSGTLVLD